MSYKDWIDFLDKSILNENIEFYKFAVLWFSFNSYLNEKFSSEHNDELKVKNFRKEKQVVDLYNRLMKGEFQDIFNGFTKTKSSGRTKVINLQDRAKYVNYNPKTGTCNDFFAVLYQIRCNYFHGEKIPDDKDDIKLIKWAYDALHCFWKEYLKQTK